MKVSLYSCRAQLPFFFARHYWLVFEEKDTKKRYEVLFYKNKSDKTLGHIFINAYKEETGLDIMPFISIGNWQGVCHKIFTGDEACKIVETLDTSLSIYPYKHKYRLWGPNSNTYIQWVLNTANTHLILPKNAFGRNFKL